MNRQTAKSAKKKNFLEILLGVLGGLAVKPALPAVEIVQVTRPDALPSSLWGAKLNVQPGPLSEYSITVRGWVLGRAASVKQIQIRSGGIVVAAGKADVKRPDITQQFSEANPEPAGFHIAVSTLPLPHSFELTVIAQLENGESIPIGTLRGTQAPLNVGFRPAMQPILVTFVGRSGSTWLMRLLSEHPQVLIYPKYPYEVRPMRYWLHVMHVLSSPADWRHSMKPNDFMDIAWVGQNPFYKPDSIQDAALRRWMGQEHAEKVVRFCLENIDTYYRHLARIEGRSNARYFAEKLKPEPSTGLLRRLYPDYREILLVRDPRDVLASARSFNAKRGKTGHGYEKWGTDIAYLERLRGFLAHQLALHDQAPGQTHLLRYERLMTQPQAALSEALGALGLDASPETVAGMLQRAEQDTAQMQRHRTSASAAQSIGRWKRDLSPELQAAASEVLGETLGRLGYEE